MPVITIETTPLTREQKERFIIEYTRIASEITGLPAQAIIVAIHEPPADNWGIGGTQLSKMQH
ncbi:4-oxalocrotonate tautomerase DmpI [Methanocella sp. MCL-LM]|uniref:4-oxalocrotonate tautomerase DmpI n=1 Tax=Methanocella sp. MCL-LM TaxID=3412035 RepID=UPI003C71888E